MEEKKCSCGHNHEECDCNHEDHECKHEGCTCECEDIVELTDDKGNPLKFYHLGTIEFKKSYYAAFQPAEEIDGLEENEMVIFEVKGVEDSDESELLPIEDQDLLDEVYEEFCRVMDEIEAEELEEE